MIDANQLSEMCFLVHYFASHFLLEKEHFYYSQGSSPAQRSLEESLLGFEKDPKIHSKIPIQKAR